MPPESLYDSGWRQGSIVRSTLSSSVLVMESGTIKFEERTADSWVIVTQDCDLDLLMVDNNEPLVEMRPVHDVESGSWGIRSRRLRLSEKLATQAQDPRIMISAAALETLRASREDLPPERTLSLKTWLGLRYDRPAVPEELVPLAKAISTAAEELDEAVSSRVRDVVMQFDDSTQPIRFSLFAILEGENDYEAARDWLSRISQRIPVELGVADELEAATADGTALSLIETGYSADVTQITWGKSGPTGAY